MVPGDVHLVTGSSQPHAGFSGDYGRLGSSVHNSSMGTPLMSNNTVGPTILECSLALVVTRCTFALSSSNILCMQWSLHWEADLPTELCSGPLAAVCTVSSGPTLCLMFWQFVTCLSKMTTSPQLWQGPHLWYLSTPVEPCLDWVVESLFLLGGSMPSVDRKTLVPRRCNSIGLLHWFIVLLNHPMELQPLQFLNVYWTKSLVKRFFGFGKSECSSSGSILKYTAG